MSNETNSADDVLMHVDEVVKRFPSGDGGWLEVLREVTMDVHAGEVLAVVGESGSGKSTLLHIMGALDRPTSGTVYFKGEDLFDKNDDELAAFRNTSIGFVFQFHHLLPEFSALENVAMPALIRQQSLEDVRERATGLLDALGMADRAEHRPSRLSGGEKQRVAMARALMNEPDLVLADEPTGNLDSQTAESLHREIRRLSTEFGQTFVLVTHNHTLASLAGRVLELKRGTLTPMDKNDLQTGLYTSK